MDYCTEVSDFTTLLAFHLDLYYSAVHDRCLCAILELKRRRGARASMTTLYIYIP